MEVGEIDKIKNRIWITERCHMRAEKRNRFLEHYFHVALALYALSSIGISIFEPVQQYPNFKAILTFTSIITLSISLLIFGFKFGETAAQHRSCYLILQKLRVEENVENRNRLGPQYIDTLSYYPNHSTQDYLSTVISNIFYESQELKDSNGDYIKVSIASRGSYCLYWATTRIMTVVFILSPVALLLIATGVLQLTGAS